MFLSVFGRNESLHIYSHVDTGRYYNKLGRKNNLPDMYTFLYQLVGVINNKAIGRNNKEFGWRKLKKQSLWGNII